MLDKITESYIDGNGNIVIQNADNSKITINVSDNNEVRKFLIQSQDKLSQLPTEILNQLKAHLDLEKEITIGANIYLTVIAAISDYGKNNVLWGVTITNLTKEIRYFNRPYFKVTPTLKLDEGLEHDTFLMFPNERIDFPVRLEYGQVVTLTFSIVPNAFAAFKESASPEAYIEVFCGTTVGELYSSNQYKLEKFVSEYMSIMKIK